MTTPNAGSSFVPALGWLKSYEGAWLKADVVAGLTTGAIVIPKAMAYATIAGLPLQVGLYTAFLHIKKEGFFLDLASIAGHLPETSLPTLAVAAGTFLVIILFEKFLPKAPTPLIAVAGGIAASALLGLNAQGVSIVGNIPGGFPTLTLPDLSLVLVLALWPAAAGIALMSFTETIAAGKAFTRHGDPRPDSNQELVGIGAANIIGGLFGAMPSGGGTSQTAVNLQAGARTQAAELITAAMTVATMIFLAPVMGAMPNATLAAVVIAYSVGLISPKEIAAIRRIRVYEFRWAIAACAGVVLLGTLKGILAAVIISMASLLHQANKPPVHVLGRKRGTHVFRPRSAEHPDDESIPGLLLLRTEGRMYFGNAQAVGEKMRALVDSEKPRVVVLDCGAIPGIEYTALRMLVEGEEKLREEGVEFWLAALNPEALEMVRRTPLAERLGRERMFFTVEDAVAAFGKRSAS
jgi:MFS superfamily sulfate permease-like transporter